MLYNINLLDCHHNQDARESRAPLLDMQNTDVNPESLNPRPPILHSPALLIRVVNFT